MKATDILRAEHDVILDVLAALETIDRAVARGAELDRASATSVIEFLRVFVDRCHHGKEEELFFAALEARGFPREAGPLLVMQSEHARGRTLVASMQTALAADDAKAFAEAGDALVTLLREHIAKENGVLFPMGDSALTEASQKALVAAFERFEHADMAAGTHERFLATARELCERHGVEPGARAPAMASGGCCGHHGGCHG